MPRRPHTSPQTQAVLQVLLRTPDTWTHGYELSKATDLKSGTLYPILRRLAQDGWLIARWEDSPHPGKPPRHAYQLTPEGRTQAQARSTPGLTLKGTLA